MPRQIPLRELPHDMTVRVPDPEAAYGGEYLDPVEIRHVRFERTEALNPRAYALADGAQGRIWIDAANSEGAFEVPKGSKIDVLGRAEGMQAASCTAYEIAGRVHHWEVDVK